MRKGLKDAMEVKAWYLRVSIHANAENGRCVDICC